MKEVSGYNPSKDQRLINCKTECGNEWCFAKRYGLFAEKTCPNYKEPSLRTNADRIRAMSVEEMAEWLRDFGDCDGLNRRCNGFGKCKECWIDWLKQEVSE